MLADLEILVTGADHTGKTSLIALIAHALEEQGLTNVILQRIDPQLDDKLENTDKARARLKDQKIFIREMRA